MNDRHDRSFCFGPTHEEVITDIVRNELNTYKQLPVNFYQIQTKFRDEIRPRYGVMRAREFLMKDSYSFHLDQASLNEEYKKIGQAYDNIFNKLGLDYRKVRADSGEIGGSTSHEYHVLAESGEDEIGYCDEENFAANVETIKSKNAPNGGHLSFARGIEVGHIFQLGDKYSRSMKCNVLDNSGKSVDLMMGCYGIGISRIVAASIEQNHDKSGIIWPKEITPFKIIIIAILKKDDDTVLSKSNQLYDSLVKSGHEVALDDRNERAGVKFAEAELIGIPYQIIVSERGLNNNTVELVERTKNGSQDIDINTIKDYF
jgi:prolyl-tRNA synthetase